MPVICTSGRGCVYVFCLLQFVGLDAIDWSLCFDIAPFDFVFNQFLFSVMPVFGSGIVGFLEGVRMLNGSFLTGI